MNTKISKEITNGEATFLVEKIDSNTCKIHKDVMGCMFSEIGNLKVSFDGSDLEIIEAIQKAFGAN